MTLNHRHNRQAETDDASGTPPAAPAGWEAAAAQLRDAIERDGDSGQAGSGFVLLRNGKDAFAARVMLARMARCTLDIQYYIWHDDLSGSLMLDEVAAAAERGVAVRLLLDDIGVVRLDARLAELASHPLVDIRFYNPFRLRRARAINWLFEFRRLNHRMHSKSFTVDRLATIVGGRNIGDEYFAAKEKELWADLEVLTCGSVVSEVGDSFESCWRGKRARPLAEVVGRVSARKRRKALAEAREIADSDKADHYCRSVMAAPLFLDTQAGRVRFSRAKARLTITPGALDDRVPDGGCGLQSLLPEGLARPDTRLDIISAYFAPTEAGARDLTDLADGGIRVRNLTNSFASSDVGFVHAGYAPYRKRLLAAGVDLYEMPAPSDKPKTARKFVRTGSRRSRSGRALGTTLHAKAVAVDGRQLYIGSANLDPRSAVLNHETGVVIESPELAERIAEMFETDIATQSYRLRLDDRGEPQWIDQREEPPEIEDGEPGTSLLSRWLVRMLSRMRIEWLL